MGISTIPSYYPNQWACEMIQQDAKIDTAKYASGSGKERDKLVAPILTIGKFHNLPQVFTVRASLQ